MYHLAKKITSKIILVALAAFFITSSMVLGVVAQEFTQGYSTTEKMNRGTVVGLTPGQDTQVESINTDKNEALFGVVIRSNDAAVTLTEDKTGVYVATSGRFEVLISDIDGALEAGDLITTSAISGIAKKATDKEKFVLGKVLEVVDFQDQSKILLETTVTDEKGATIPVKISRVMAEIDVKANPGLKSETSAPEFLVNFSETIAGKPVSALRIYAGLIIVTIAGAISGSLLYSSVKTSIISIGRNPLSKNSVLTGLAQVVVISVIIFISGLVAVYLLLKI